MRGPANRARCALERAAGCCIFARAPVRCRQTRCRGERASRGHPCRRATRRDGATRQEQPSMPTSAFFKFQNFVEDRDKKVHDLHADALKVYLSNTTPVATMLVKTRAGRDRGRLWLHGGRRRCAKHGHRDGRRGDGQCRGCRHHRGGREHRAFRYAILYNDTPTSPRSVDWVLGLRQRAHAGGYRVHHHRLRVEQALRHHIMTSHASAEPPRVDASVGWR